jgi:Fe-S-cluster-containing hydrogenase component 2
MSLRVRIWSKCIECYECEKACEKRYGVKRCRSVARCWAAGLCGLLPHLRRSALRRSVCGYDSIKFDTEKGEVVISEDLCTGCGMCALACPYDAIEMHELDDKPLLLLRLQKEKKLDWGDNKPRKAKPRRIASKCDHCVNYEDQACISRLSHRALIVEIPPEVAFVERTERCPRRPRAALSTQRCLTSTVSCSIRRSSYKGLSEEDDNEKAGALV